MISITFRVLRDTSPHQQQGPPSVGGEAGPATSTPERTLDYPSAACVPVKAVR